MSDIQNVQDWLDEAETGMVDVVVEDTTDLSSLALAADRVSLANAELHRFAGKAREDGRSWTEIGNAVGTTRQAAQQRFGHSLSA